MDGYAYSLDPYRQASAGYYPPRSSYGLERRSSYGDPLASYARVPVDPYVGYGAAVYQPEVVRYVPVPTSPVYRSRPRPMPGKKNAPAQNLGPKKKPFKQTQKVRFTEEKERPLKKNVQRNSSQGVKKSDNPNTKQAASLAKETQELHKLFRTGVDANAGKKVENEKGNENGAVKKRKAETQSPKQTKKSGNAKKQKGKKNKKLAKEKKLKVESAEPPLRTEEELKELEAGLELQRGLCKGVSEFLGIPESKEAANVSESEAKGEEVKESEKPTKPEEPQRTPEEEKEIEAKSFKFFSGLFEEHSELRNIYIEKCNSGSFECLVCHSADPAKSKKFWNVVSLVMHTKMRKQMQPEHSGYGRAVSAVLGWDHDKTPKVPRGSKPAAPAEKVSDQVKEETKSEVEETKKEEEKDVDQDQNEAETNATEDQEEETAAENPPESNEE